MNRPLVMGIERASPTTVAVCPEATEKVAVLATFYRLPAKM